MNGKNSSAQKMEKRLYNWHWHYFLDNPTLVTNFIGAVKIMNDRLSSSSGLFGRQEWRTTSDHSETAAREKVQKKEKRKNKAKKTKKRQGRSKKRKRKKGIKKTNLPFIREKTKKEEGAENQKNKKKEKKTSFFLFFGSKKPKENGKGKTKGTEKAKKRKEEKRKER